MRAALFLFLALSFTSPIRARANEPKLSPSLAPLAPFAGSCWYGRFEGGKVVDIRCITPILGGTHVRDVHRVEGTSYAGETIYSWDPQTDAIQFRYYNVLGGVAAGTLRVVANGLAGESEYRDPEGKVRNMSTRWTISGDIMTQVNIENGQQISRLVFERRPPDAFPDLVDRGCRAGN